MANKTYEKAFENTYEALQCLTWTILYYHFDFGKDNLIKFQRQLTISDGIIDDKNLYIKTFEKLRDKYGVDCIKLTRSFPYISKVKIANIKKAKGIKDGVHGCDNAMEVYFVILFYELISKWGMNREDIDKFYEKLKENAELYRKGMKNDFVKKYFKDELDLNVFL